MRSTILRCLVALVLSSGGPAFFLHVEQKQVAQARQLASQGLIIEAEITGKSMKPYGVNLAPFTTAARVDYRFRLQDGMVIETSSSIDPQALQDERTGAEQTAIAVTYLPEAPQVNIPSVEIDERQHFHWLGTLAMFFACSLAAWAIDHSFLREASILPTPARTARAHGGTKRHPGPGGVTATDVANSTSGTRQWPMPSDSAHQQANSRTQKKVVFGRRR